MPPLERRNVDDVRLTDQVREEALLRERLRAERVVRARDMAMVRARRQAERLAVENGMDINDPVVTEWMQQLAGFSMGYETYYAQQPLEPFTPEPKKVVEITEEDELPVNYDIDDEAERQTLPENKSFYKDTKGKLSQVSELLDKVAIRVLPFLEKDKFFSEQKIANKRYAFRFLLHGLWEVYRAKGEFKEKNTFPSLDVVKQNLAYLQAYTIDSNAKANTYIYKYIDEIVDIVEPVFREINSVGDIKMDIRNNVVELTLKGEKYRDILYPQQNSLSTQDIGFLYNTGSVGSNTATNTFTGSVRRIAMSLGL